MTDSLTGNHEFSRREFMHCTARAVTATTLAAMINYINNNRSCHIITLEDPIEYLFHPIKSIIIQRQLRTDMLSFS